MKIFKLILFLLIGLVLIGCNDQVDDNDDDDDTIVEPTLKIESTEYLIQEEQTLQLEVEILNSTEKLGIIYVSSNTTVATVSTTGLVTGKVPGFTVITIILSSYPDQRLEVIITVEEKPEETPEDIQRALADFAAIKATYDERIPDVVTNDIKLDTYLYNRFINWTTSNNDVITRFGAVTRGKEDIVVELTATMSYKHIEEVYKKVVTVKRGELRDLSNKKISFAYSRSIIMMQEHLQQIDVVNYSFASIIANKFYVTSQISTLVRQAHNNGTRVVAAVGGGDAAGSNPFRDMTATADNRKIFIDSTIAAIKEYNLDGIDYDWEFPNTPTERDNFSALVRETRAAMDAYKPGLILSSAINAGTWSVGQRYDVAELNKYLDFFHIMSYDLNNFPGADKYALTRHHTGLYRSTLAPGLSTDEAIKAYVNAGASKEKVIIGIAAYGRMATEITTPGTGLNVQGLNPAQSINFSNIYNLYYKDPENSKYTYYFDDQAKAPWLFDGSTFISFDDEFSIKAKIDYVYQNELGGAMYWDYMNDSSGRILGFIDKYLNK